MISIILRLNLFWAACSVLAYFAPYVRPADFWVPLFLGMAFPWLAIGNLVFASIWAISRMKYWWISSLCLLLGWNYLTAIYGIRRSAGAAADSESFKIMTYNVNGMSLISYKAKNNLPQGEIDFQQFFTDQKPDILCLQEFTAFQSSFDNELRRFPALAAYPFHTRSNFNSISIFSNFPIRANGYLPINKNGSNGCLYADVDLRGTMTRIYSVHLQSNEISSRADWVAEKGKLEQKHTWGEIARIFSSVRRCARIRSKEAEIVAQHIERCPYPVILCGDFNDVPLSYTYYHLSKNLKDAFRERGSGFGVTYAGNIPALKIDYILTDQKIGVLSNKIFKVPYSDHYPTVAVLKSAPQTVPSASFFKLR